MFRFLKKERKRAYEWKMEADVVWQSSEQAYANQHETVESIWNTCGQKIQILLIRLFDIR